MTKRDLILTAAWALMALLLLAPAGLFPGLVPHNFGDLAAYHYPLRHLAWSAVQAGRLPFWNPYIFSGLPLMANSQAALLYPLSLPAGMFPLTLALSWDFLFHWFWGGLGAFFLARRAGLKSWPAWTAALAYALSPFLVYRVVEGIPTLLASLAWVPWAWLAWRARGARLLAAVWGLQFLSGHPQFLVLNAVAMALWGLSRPSRADWGVFGRGVLGALLLAAAQWPLTWEFMGLSVRRSWTEAFLQAYSFEWKTLLAWLHPDAWGNPLSGTYAGPPSVFFETSGVYLGALGLALAAAGLWLSRARAAALLVLAGLLLSAGAAGSAGLLRTPARWLLLALWGLWLGLAAAWRELSRRGLPRGLAVLLGAALLAELALWDARFLRAEDSRPALAPRTDLTLTMGGAAYRVLVAPAYASPNKTMLYRARNVNGYEAFYLDGYPQYAARSEGGAAADPSRTYLSRPDTPEMRRLSVGGHLRPDGLLVPVPGSWPKAWFVDGAGARLSASARLWEPRPERWRLSASVPPGAAALVFSQPHYPGWRAFLDGREAAVEKFDGLLQSVTLPPAAAGRELSAALVFEPSAWPWLVAVMAASWAWWFLGLARRGPAA